MIINAKGLNIKFKLIPNSGSNYYDSSSSIVI